MELYVVTSFQAVSVERSEETDAGAGSAQNRTVLELIQGAYQIVGKFSANQNIVSPTLPNLNLTQSKSFSQPHNSIVA